MIADDETDPRRLVPYATLPDVSSGALGRLRSALDLRRAARAVSGATAAATAAASSAASVAAAAAASGLRLGRALGTPQPADPSDWTVARLRALIAGELAGADVILVSNREPYVHSAGRRGITCAVPAGGLVSALEPIARGCGGTWIAHGSGSADRETVDDGDRIALPPGNPSYTLRRVWLSPEEVRGYYLGFANESLWPLCHNAYVRPVFREEDWFHYRTVNERFADAVVQEARSDAPLVIVQDYHFALLPRMIRDRLPNATIASFWHIPWPNAEVFGICPYAAELLDGMLGADLIGFQVPLFRINFAECVERTLESRINREDWSVLYGGEESCVRTYPISIEWPDAADRDRAPEESIRAAFPMQPDARLILAVGRLDYTKGIPEILQAFEMLLERHPELQGKVHLYHVAAPSRGEVSAYRALHRECLRLVAAINARFGSDEYRPILFVDRHADRAELSQCYREADVCVVPSLHDGMNLVAKEFVAQRRDEDGVLILSRFAGAIHELPEALRINPFDAAGMAEAMKSALDMPAAEQAERMRRMRETVRTRNIYRWAGKLLEDAAQVRGRNRLKQRAATVPDRPRLLSPQRAGADPAAKEVSDAPSARS